MVSSIPSLIFDFFIEEVCVGEEIIILTIPIFIDIRRGKEVLKNGEPIKLSYQILFS